MRVGIFYFSHRDGEGRSPVSLGLLTFPAHVGYVRCEVVESDSEEDALDRAVCRPEETLMNTHALKDIRTKRRS